MTVMRIPITICVTRRVEKPGLCEVPDCNVWPWLQVQTTYSDDTRHNTNLCHPHGIGFLAGLPEVWVDTETPPSRSRVVSLSTDGSPVDAIAEADTEDAESTAHD